MKFRITKKDLVLVALATVVLAVAALLAAVVRPAAVVPVTVIMAAIVVLFVVIEVYRRIDEQMTADMVRHDLQRSQIYQQVESSLALYATLRPTQPLPPTRSWAASPDLLRKLTELVLVQQPHLIVEASSGVSTLVMAYALNQLGRGRIVSFENDAKFAAISQAVVNQHGLGHIATVVHAPLVAYERGGQHWQWYDTGRVTLDRPIDLFVIDGPPGFLQPLSRYPAIPVFYDRLADGATVVLDDAARPDERRIVERWLSEYPGLSAEFIELEKGASVLRKGAPVSA